MTKNDGGPAFPSVLYSHEREENWSTDGMTLRQYYAGQMMAAIIVGNGAAGCALTYGAAKDAISAADALIAELEK